MENIQKKVTSAYMTGFQDPAKVFNSAVNLNNFMINNEGMKEIIESVEIENKKEEEKDKDHGEKESSFNTLSLNPLINSLSKELISIMKVLISKIVDFQALGRDCRGSGRGGVGEENYFHFCYYFRFCYYFHF